MNRWIRSVGFVAILALSSGPELFACGDKFLAPARGTRYQRPKNARAASVLIFAEPSSNLPSLVGRQPLEAVLKRQGHRSTTAYTTEQLSALLAQGRFDVVLAAESVVAAVEKVLGGGSDFPVIVAFCAKDAAGKGPCAITAPAKERSLLEAIDKAVQRRDHTGT